MERTSIIVVLILEMLSLSCVHNFYVDADCSVNNGGCHSNADCSDDGATVICKCMPGYVGNGSSCILQDQSAWLAKGLNDVKLELKKKKNTKMAKNVIIFIGDGMGASTVTAARILEGQTRGELGEDNVLAFEEFENVALAKTYCVNQATPDSSCTATAMLSGVKTNAGVLGLDAYAEFGNCASVENATQLETVLHWAQAAGKRTGIITTNRVTHATPAAAYANIPNRFWEGDTQVKAPCIDIAKQLIDDNPNINVLLGGGRRHFLPNTTTDPETGKVDDDQRQDGRNLVTDWQNDKETRGKTYSYVWNREQFLTVSEDTEFFLGLFSPSRMDFDLQRTESGPSGEPSLAEMVEKAIDILEKGNKGFFLLVEGALIDLAHHINMPKLALYDAIALHKAVKAAKTKTDSKDTLTLVTADHSLSLNMGGYAKRGSAILGKVTTPEAIDKKPVTMLQYANGPGYKSPREDLTGVDTTKDTFRFPSGIPFNFGTHTGDDVAIYATGPMSHLINGVKEQSYIAYVMAFASCIGPYSTGEMFQECKQRNQGE